MRQTNSFCVRMHNNGVNHSFIHSSSELFHIIFHHGDSRSDVYKRIWQILWFSEKLGQEDSSNSRSPTFVYPVDLREAVRARFPDAAAGQHDQEYEGKPGVHTVTWAELKSARWPEPPKSCMKCKKRGSPY